MTDTLSAYNPSWRERLQGAVQDAMTRMGASRGYSQEFSSKAGDLISMVPGAGNALSANDAYRAYQGGDYLGAAMNGAMALPLPLATPEEDAARGIIAYHGSPYSFDKFDASKIGTGEGAQAYGHGLYFAQNEDTARSYRYMRAPVGQDARGARIVADALAEANSAGLEGTDAKAYAMKLLDTKAKGPASWAPPQAYYDAMNNFDALSGGQGAAGQMYQVRINADPDQFLDWDKPLSEQPQTVQDFVNSHPDARRLSGNSFTQGQLSEPTGQDIHNRMSGLRSPELQQAGIPGIRYLDQGSRGAGDGTYNYVVFDPNTIDILKRYGLAGGLAGTGVGAAILNPPTQTQPQL